MKKPEKFKRFVFTLLLGFILISACAIENLAALEGRVIFGPLSPIIQEDAPELETPPEFYVDRFVLIYNETGDTLLEKAPLDPNGYYRITLIPGTYIVDFTFVGIEHAKNLPASITLKPGQVIDFEISVDTGIR